MNQPKLHILELHESPVVNGDNYDRFSMQWILDTAGATADMAETFAFGDVLLIPELLTGAGEFEGMRFLGPKLEGNGNRFEILPAGVEYPELPAIIVDSDGNGEKGQSVKEKYEILFEIYLKNSKCGVETLLDLNGGDKEDLAQWWANPPIQRRRKYQSDEEWVIPLKDCTRVETAKS